MMALRILSAMVTIASGFGIVAWIGDTEPPILTPERTYLDAIRGSFLVGVVLGALFAASACGWIFL